MQFLTAVEVRRFETDSPKEKVNPFFARELVAARPVLFKVEGRNLNRLQAVDPKRTAFTLLVFVVLVPNIQLRPNTAHQQSVVIPQEVFGYVDVPVTEVLQFGPVLVIVGYIPHRSEERRVGIV